MLFSCCALLVCRYLTVNTAASLPSWRLVNQHFIGVTQEWQSREKSSCLDFKSCSLIPGLLCLSTVQESAFSSFNTIRHEDCTSDSLFLLCKMPWYPDEMLGRQELPLATISAPSSLALSSLHSSPGLKMKSITGTSKYELTCNSFFKLTTIKWYFKRKNISKSSHTTFCSLLGKGKPIKYEKNTTQKENMDILDPVWNKKQKQKVKFLNCVRELGGKG